MVKIIIRAAIELTRRCNMNCAHCLRGDAQNIDIADEHIDNFFKYFKNSEIIDLALTGGEPSLVPEKIMRVLDAAKKNDVNVTRLYVATNNTNYLKLDKALKAANECCSDVIIRYSDDKYHEEQAGVPIYLRKTEDIYLLRQGRVRSNIHAHDFTVYPPKISPESKTYSERIFQEKVLNHIYLNCKGNVIYDVYFDYENQDNPNVILFNINNAPENLEDMLDYRLPVWTVNGVLTSGKEIVDIANER